jgi:hypothetical protein
LKKPSLFPYSSIISSFYSCLSKAYNLVPP